MRVGPCESWTIKKAECQRIDAFQLWCWRRLLRVPWTARRFKPVRLKGNESWIFTGRIDAEAETLILRPSDAKNWLIRKDPDAGQDGRWEEKGMTENEMVGCHHQLDGHEFEQAPGVGDGQGSLVCCSPRCRKESDATEWVNWTEVRKISLISRMRNMWSPYLLYGRGFLRSAPAIASIHWRQSLAIYPVVSMFLTENVKGRLVVNCLTWSPSISFLN